MKKPRILFLYQSAGPLFREMAEDISKQWPVCELYTGHPDTLEKEQKDYLRIVRSPMYDRSGGYILRLWSWFKYLFCSFFKCLRTNRDTVLFLVFPPFLELIAYFFKKTRKQRYVILVYDIYPDTFINFGPLKANGIIACAWRWMYRVIWKDAEIVFTIGSKMAKKVEKMFDSSKTAAGKVVVIPTWANTDWIKPLAKEKNKFAQKYDQVGKLTVMYSGNLGQTHDIGTIVEAARELKNTDSVRFMIIGDGAKRGLVEQAKRKDNLHNLTFLNWQSEDILPYSLATADIAVITLDKGSEGLSVPSKTFYAMASGAALIALCDKESELADIIEKHDCGVVIEPGDVNAMIKAILDLFGDEEKLKRYKTNSRSAAEKYYSRNNTKQYIDALSSYLNI
jgi:glycosyltransferase involved in cell wall biosynthesis